MLWQTFRYEMKRSMPQYGMWMAIFFAFALIARLHLFSLTDLPLFYLMFFSSLGIMLYRYYSSMHGKEATYLFTLDLSAGKQMLVRYGSIAIWSIITAGLIGIILAIQGEDLGRMIQNLPSFQRVLLVVEVSFSLFALIVLISTALSLSYIRPFSERHTVWFIIFTIALLATVSLLSKATEHIFPANLVISEAGKILVSESTEIPSSVSFSFNMFLWNTVCSIVCMICMPAIIRKKLLITG